MVNNRSHVRWLPRRRIQDVQSLIQLDDHARSQYIGNQTKQQFDTQNLFTAFCNILGNKYVSLVRTTLVHGVWRNDGFSEVPRVKLSVPSIVIQRPPLSGTPADKAQRPPTRRSPLPAHQHTRRCRRMYCLSILLDDSQTTGVSSIEALCDYVCKWWFSRP